MRSAALLALALALPLAATPAVADTAGTATAANAPPAAEELALPAITVSVVGKRKLTDRVLASGFVSPVEEVQVQPLVEGQPIEALLADVGDYVTEGQVLAKLSRSTLELQKSQLEASHASALATIAQAEAQVVETRSSAEEAQRVSARTAALRKAGSSSQAAADQTQAAAVSALSRVSVAVQTLEAARAQLTFVEAQIANVDLQLTRTDVVAPVAGEIVQRNAQLGSIATSAGSTMFTLVRGNALELRADVSGSDLLRISAGQSAGLTVGTASAPIAGTVRLVEPTIDATTRMGRARIEISQTEHIRSGMFVEAEILIAEREAVAVPVTALGTDPDGNTVMLVEDGVISRRPVKTGIRDGGWVEITEGLAVGDTVVTKAGAFVRPGDQINPIPAPETN